MSVCRQITNLSVSGMVEFQIIFYFLLYSFINVCIAYSEYHFVILKTLSYLRLRGKKKKKFHRFRRQLQTRVYQILLGDYFEE